MCGLCKKLNYTVGYAMNLITQWVMQETELHSGLCEKLNYTVGYARNLITQWVTQKT